MAKKQHQPCGVHDVDLIHSSVPSGASHLFTIKIETSSRLLKSGLPHMPTWERNCKCGNSPKFIELLICARYYTM